MYTDRCKACTQNTTFVSSKVGDTPIMKCSLCYGYWSLEVFDFLYGTSFSSPEEFDLTASLREMCSNAQDVIFDKIMGDIRIAQDEMRKKNEKSPNRVYDTTISAYDNILDYMGKLIQAKEMSGGVLDG